MMREKKKKKKNKIHKKHLPSRIFLHDDRYDTMVAKKSIFCIVFDDNEATEGGQQLIYRRDF